MDRSALLSHLDSLGIPHAATIRELTARYGVRQSRYFEFSRVVEVEARPLVPHQVDPFELRPTHDPDLLPPPQFRAYASVGSDARKNHAATLTALSALLGTPVDVSVSNTLTHRWSFDTAAITIQTWPPELQDPQTKNPSHDRHPELRTYCDLTIRPGHVPAASAAELGWMRDAIGLAPTGPQSLRATITPVVCDSDVYSTLQGSVRRVPTDLRRPASFVGITHRGAAVVGIDGDLGFVIDARAVSELRLHRVAPARGPGGATLYVVYADAYASDRAVRDRPIFASPTLAGLDALTETLARRLGATATSEDFIDD